MMKPLKKNPTIPFGYCQCSCGEKTTIIKQSVSKKGYIKGQPHPYLRCHHPACGWQPTARVAEFTASTPDPNPSGLCMCGCGGQTKLSENNDLRYGIVKGAYQRYIAGHRSRVPKPPRPAPPVVSRLCKCGCGQETPLAKYTDTVHGATKGVPISCIQGHGRRSSPLLYVEEDRGYKTPCWIWQRYRQKGYGRTWDTVRKIKLGAHRLFYEVYKGPIPKGLTIDHLCKVPACVNPDHLEPVTSSVNSRRAINSKLNEERVRRIRWLHSVGVRYSELGKIYGVTWQTTQAICNRHAWKGVS